MKNVESKEKQQEILAVDVVILPPNEVSNLAIAFNRKLDKAPFRLGQADYLPHITLAAGYIGDLSLVENQLGQIAESSSSFEVVINGLISRDMVPEWKGSKYDNALNIIKNPDVLSLHNRLVAELPFVDLQGQSV